MASVSWITSSMLAQNGTEKLLRVGLLFPKLKSNHGERKADVFRTSEPVPSAMAHPKERATLTPAPLPPAFANPKVTIVDAPPSAFGPMPTPEPPRFDHEPWLTMVSKVDGPTPIETCLDPVVYLEPCAPKRGDTPMIRNWKMLTMLSLLSAATVQWTPPPIVAGEKDSPSDLKKSIDALIKRIDALEKKPLDTDTIAEALRTELKKLENGALADIRTDIGNVNKELRTQKKELEDQRVLINLLSGRIDGLERKLGAGAGAPTPAVDKAFMEELRTMMKNLTDTLAKGAPSQSHVAMSPPTGNGTNGNARVMLVNHYPEMLLFVINGVGHRLEARSSMVVDVPAGSLSYRVHSTRYGTLEERMTKVASGHTFNLSAQ